MKKYETEKIAKWITSFIGIVGITQLLIFPNQDWFTWVAITLSSLILIFEGKKESRLGRGIPLMCKNDESLNQKKIQSKISLISIDFLN